MAATIKYLTVFRDHYNRVVTVGIVAADYLGTPIGLTTAADPLTITYNGDDGDIFQTMITSKAKLSLLLGEENTEFYEDITTMDENTFGLQIVVRNPNTAVIEYKWEGWLVPDEQSRNFSYTNQEITLTAIDPIGRTKGQKLLNSDGSYIYGKQTIKYIVNRCIQDVFTPDNTFATFNLVIDSDLVLSNTTSTILPDIFDQLKINSEAFNDEVGRPKSGFDVLEMIAKAMFMRVFYENGNVYFVDILNYSSLSTSPSIVINPVFYSSYPNVTEANNTILLQNTENITRTRVYRDSICKFTYTNAIGLLKDGTLINWTAISGGYKLTEWYYSPYLSARADVYNRRQGNGRAENAYGMLIKYTSDHVSGDDYQNRQFDVICTKTPEYVYFGQKFTLDISVKFAHPEAIPYVITVDGWQNIAALPVFIYIINRNDTTNSYYLNKDSVWTVIDLSGTDFDVLGQPDWVTVLGAYDADLNPGSPSSFDDEPLKSIYFNGNALVVPLQGVGNTQDLTVEIPEIPQYCTGEMFVFIHPAVNTRSDLSNAGTDTIVYKALLSSKIANIINGFYSGEIQYLSREIRTSQDNITREISFNTTDNKTIAGAISSAIPITETSGVIPPGNLSKICLKDYPEPLFSGVSLMAYNAIGQMWLNYAQFKIDFQTLSKKNNFSESMAFFCLVDPDRPSTDIYNNIFIQNTSEYNVKKSTRKITAISTKPTVREITQAPDGELDETHDFSEFYYLK
jgi:hypothetical protein